MKKRFISIFSIVLITVIVIYSFPLSAYAKANHETKDNIGEEQKITFGEAGGYLAGSLKTTKQLYEDRKFSTSQGHGFAAEKANILYDRLSGIKSSYTGDDNVKNGADRTIFNRNGSDVLIQDKYWKTATESVKDAFGKDGFYKYIDGDDMPMQLEVPKDQYKEAVLEMKKYIRDGKVKNITNEAEAENIVREGKVTYKQAVNITKAGNIDSLKYDAIHGVVSAAYATGISFAINYTLAMINGNDSKTALINSLNDSLKTGAVIGITSILASQLAKAGFGNIYVPAASAISKVLGEKVCAQLLETAGVNATKNSAVKIASKLIANNIQVQVVLLIVLTVPEVVDLLRGRISAKQLLINVGITASGLVGGAIGMAGGALLGSALPGPGNVIGGFLGGILGSAGASFGTSALIDNFTETDAEEMCNIIQDEFVKLSAEYIINKNEGEKIAEKLQKKLDGNTIKDMYSSKDRNKFANRLLTELFDEQVAKRNISIPSEKESRETAKSILADVVFIH